MMKAQLLATAVCLAMVPTAVFAQRDLPRETVVGPQPAVTATPQAVAQRTAATCTATTTLDFSQRTVNESWKNLAPFVVGGSPNNTTISTAGTYVEPGTGNQTFLFIDDPADTYFGVKNLVWYTDYISQTNATTQIVFSFNRPVNGYSFRIQDIDDNNSNYTDEVTLDAYQSNGTLLSFNNAADATAAINNSAYVRRINNTLEGLQQNPDLQQNGSATVTFNKPITRLVITYRNIINATPGVQYIGIDNMTWCTQANVATTINGPARAIAGSQVTYTVATTASGDYAAPNVQPQVQLVPGLNSQSPVFPAGSSYNNTTGLLTLATIPTLAVGTTNTSEIRFNMPNSTVTGQASSTIGNDDADPADNNGSLAAANVTTTTNTAPTAQTRTATVSRNTTVFTAMPALSGTDPENDPLTYTIVGSSIANINFGTVYFTRNGARTAVSGSTNITLTAAEAATLEFQANNTATATSSRSFSYFTADPFGGVSPSVNYTISVGDRPAVYSSPNVHYFSSLADNTVLATVTDPDASIVSTSAVQTSGTTTRGIQFNSNGTAVSRLVTNGPQSGRIDLPPAGVYGYSVTTTDANGGVTVSNVTITILAGDNEAAYSTNNRFNRDALTSGSQLATVTDVDGGVQSATIGTGTLATGMSFNNTTGVFNVGASVPFAGTYTYTVNTTDAVGGLLLLQPPLPSSTTQKLLTQQYVHPSIATHSLITLNWQRQPIPMVALFRQRYRRARCPRVLL
ncbi:DUF11 domain-containing protein [Hymenobacter oligotrophus]|uniref:DUF11 domain-containing protein n=1 Tax=Hymenobacter oligotrophus TaxID=2319843 RepID=UPI0013C3417C|nr:DUF11 domain-containing protein [Hymenobacter oligotrophus]